MKRRGPPLGSGPGSDGPRVVAERFATLLAGTALTVVLTPHGRSRFDTSFNGTHLVQASKNPISDGARVLHRMGYSDHRLLVAQHEGAAHYAMRGPLGHWRKIRIREDRGLRHVAWEPRPRRVGAKKGRGKLKGVRPGPEKKSTSTNAPGAVKRHWPASGPSVESRSI